MQRGDYSLGCAIPLARDPQQSWVGDAKSLYLIYLRQSMPFGKGIRFSTQNAVLEDIWWQEQMLKSLILTRLKIY